MKELENVTNQDTQGGNINTIDMMQLMIFLQQVKDRF